MTGIDQIVLANGSYCNCPGCYVAKGGSQDIADLIRAVCDAPRDVAVWLVLADAIAATGDLKWAEALRKYTQTWTCSTSTTEP